MAVEAPTLEMDPSVVASHAPQVEVPQHPGVNGAPGSNGKPPSSKPNGNAKKRVVKSDSSSEDEKPLVRGRPPLCWLD